MDEKQNKNDVKKNINNNEEYTEIKENIENNSEEEEADDDIDSIYQSALNLQETEYEMESGNQTEKENNDRHMNTPILENGEFHFDNGSCKEHLKISEIHLFLPWLSLALYLFDVLSDQFLAIKYFRERQWKFASLTCIFVLIPALYISVFVGKTW